MTTFPFPWERDPAGPPGVWVCPMTLACLFGVVVGFTLLFNPYPVAIRRHPFPRGRGWGCLCRQMKAALVVKGDTITFEYHGKRAGSGVSIDTRGGAKQQQTNKKGKK